MSKLEELLQLIKENPELPVIPMVDGDLCGDEYGRYIGEIGRCYIGAYVICDERVYFDREEFTENLYDLNDEDLCKHFGFEPYGANDFTTWANKVAEKKLDDYLNAVAERVFKPAIIVNIDIPADSTYFDMTSIREELK